MGVFGVQLLRQPCPALLYLGTDGCWCHDAFTGMQGMGFIALLAKRLCEARYQIQEESCRSLEEAWDRGEEPPHQTLNAAPASWPCTWYVGTNTTVRPGRRRSPIPSGRNLWIHPGSPRKPMPWVSQHLWAETPFTADINFSQSGCEATFLF